MAKCASGQKNKKNPKQNRLSITMIAVEYSCRIFPF